jgi:hypothetical protein
MSTIPHVNAFSTANLLTNQTPCGDSFLQHFLNVESKRKQVEVGLSHTNSYKVL